MQVKHGTIQPGSGPVALTIGNFDGIHRGHRAMLGRLIARSRELGLPACVLTFEPHPREFFARGAGAAGAPPVRLTRLREKLERMAEAGVDRVHILRFDARLAAMAAPRFLEEMLVRGLEARWLLVGRDFRFGARRAGDYALLASEAGRLGYELEPMHDVLQEGTRVSSSGVRAALEAGDLARAARLLGREYSMSGRVAHGEKLGRTLGFPTANIIVRRVPPLAGIFAVRAELEELGQVRHGVACVGRRPTVREGAAPLLEVHLFDWQGDLYGRHLRVTFLEKLRDEEKYDGVEALRAAISRDAERAREFFMKASAA
ncbi:MAG TPA: bifunctional riboflavin kinase/FAD synthetase [Burkholderiales bacterium]|nr:bifunctional riboflavin kinase/FAD synthetase [Burkholderiales bacterium]